MSPYTVLRMPNFFQTFLIAPSLYPVSSVFAAFIGSSFSFTEIFSFSHSLCFSSPYIYIYFYFRKWNLPDMFPTNWLLYHLLWSTTQGRLTYTNTQINLSFLKAFDQIKSWLTLPAWCSGFVVQSLSLCNPMDCNTPDFPVLHCLPEFAQTRVLWVDDTIQPSCPLSSSSPSAFNLSQHQGLFQWVSSLHQVAQVLELQWTSVLLMNIQEWFPLVLTHMISLQSNGVLKSLLQHHSSEVSILWHSSFLMFQLSYPYMTTGKTIASTRQTFVSNVSAF